MQKINRLPYYQERLNNVKTEIKKQKIFSRRLLWIKLLMFISFIITLYFTVTAFHLLWSVFSILSFLSYITAYVWDVNVQKKIDFHEKMELTYLHEICYLKGDFSPFYDGSEYINPQHPYSFDLDIFGHKSLFHRINRTTTEGGKRKLAEWLSTLPKESDSVLLRQEAINELADMEQWRTHFIALSEKDNKLTASTIEQLFTTVDKPSMLFENRGKMILLLSIGITLLTIALSAVGIAPPMFAITLFIIQLFIPNLFGKKLKTTTDELQGLHKVIYSYSCLITHIDNTIFKSRSNVETAEAISGSAKAITAFASLSKILRSFDQRGNIFAHILFNGLFIRDLWLLRRYALWKKEYAPHIMEWVEAISTFDARISLATFNFNHPENCTPSILPLGDTCIDTKGVYHPFLEPHKAVSNDFHCSRNHFYIITGANMAGKSTLLRAIGINYILTLCGCNVCASMFSCATVNLFSSMRTTDNLSENISYFNAELIRLEQLIESVESHPHTLLILDEILKGTNSKDKLKGSRMFLMRMREMKASGIIATHDLDIAQLEEEQKESFSNYCFDIALTDPIQYSYKMHRGIAKNLNASYLMEKLLQKIEKNK